MKVQEYKKNNRHIKITKRISINSIFFLVMLNINELNVVAWKKTLTELIDSTIQ